MRHSICYTVILSSVLAAVVPCHAAAPLLEQATLFQSGQGGHVQYRIPALAVTTRGTVLAFCEGRNGGGDFGDNDLVLRRSEDGGRNWSDIQEIANDGTHAMGNPCPVVDRTTGVIWLPFCRDCKSVLLTTSSDDGRTWSPPIDITSGAIPAGSFLAGTGPGHGIQLASGRLLIPCWKESTSTLGEIQTSYAFFSDDHGATWKAGQSLTNNASDECQSVQLANGNVYMNMRCSLPAKRQRAYSLSSDGGDTWSPVQYDPNLPDPGCQGSVVRLTDAVGFDRNRVLLSNPANPHYHSRDTMTIRLSYDECGSWPVSKVLCAGYSGYSDLAVTDDHGILCLYETDGCAKITLARFNLEWLSDGKDSVSAKTR